jgi:hypothetical protein
MEGRRVDLAYAAVVALTALQVLLVYTVGGARYEFLQVIGVVVLAVALVKLGRGSFVAWSVLVVINVMPLADAIMIDFAPGTSMAASLVVIVATSGPLLALLLSPPMRRRIRHTAPEPQSAAVPTA